MTYHPLRGGHAPSYVRDAFADAVESFVDLPDDVDFNTLWKLIGSIHSLTAKLWNCTDLMSPELKADFENLMRSGDNPIHTYAQGARFLRNHLRREKPRVRVKASSRRLSSSV